jgi:uncharacterized protein
MNTDTYPQPMSVAELDDNSRGRFISRTYTHLFLSIMAFTLIEIALFKTGFAERMFAAIVGAPWLIIMGAFVIVSWLASRVAHRAESKAAQYAALIGFILAEAVVFVPILYIANQRAEGVITSAAFVTFIGFVGLSLVAFFTRKDFSFLRGILCWGGVLGLVAIVAGVIFGFNLGMWFSVAMVALAGASILYDTSNVLHHYSEDRYVAAALELFASVAMMFWYVLRIFLSRR